MKKAFVLISALMLASSVEAAPQRASATPSQSRASQAESTRSLLKGAKLRPLFGYQIMNPKALNSELQTRFTNGGSNVKVGNAIAFGAAAEYPVYEESIYAGLRVEHFTSSGDAVTISQQNKGSAQATVSGTPVMATLGYALPVAPQWTFGTTVGAGVALGYTAALEIAGSSDTTTLPNGTLEFGSTPFTGMAAASMTYDFTSSIGLRFETGYRLLSSKQMKAQSSYAPNTPNAVKEGELLRDANNVNVPVNSNAFTTGVSLTITL